MFLEECKYAVKRKKIPKYIIGDIEIPLDSARENSDEESLIEKILIKKFPMKKIKKY